MLVLHEQGYSFRLAAVLTRFVHWETGRIFPSNGTLARLAGRCSTSTISNDISAFKKMGLLQIETTYPPNSKFPLRILWPSLPIDLFEMIDAATVSDVLNDTASDDVQGGVPTQGEDAASEGAEDTLSDAGNDALSDALDDTVSEQPRKRHMKGNSA